MINSGFIDYSALAEIYFVPNMASPPLVSVVASHGVAVGTELFGQTRSSGDVPQSLSVVWNLFPEPLLLSQ